MRVAVLSRGLGSGYPYAGYGYGGGGTGPGGVGGATGGAGPPAGGGGADMTRRFGARGKRVPTESRAAPKRLREPSRIHDPRRDGVSLLEETSEIIGLQVYTHSGVFLGNVNNLVVDVDNGAVDGIFVGETNPLLVEGSRAVSIPYRWVQSVGDIVILRYFPKRVSAKKAPSPAPAK